MGGKTSNRAQERFCAFHKATHHVALPVSVYSCLFYRPQNCQNFAHRFSPFTIIDQLKNISQIEHSRHRSPINFVVHLIAGLLAYSFQDKKPGLHLDERALLAA